MPQNEVPRDPRIIPEGSKIVVRVSQDAFNHVEDLKQACLRIAQADPTDRDAVNDAYADYVMRQKELYEYISALEVSQRIPQQPVVMWF